MAGNPREHVAGKGFWDGGSEGHSTNSQAAGRPSGFPGRRTQSRVGVKTDIEFPSEETESQDSRT